MNKFVLTLLAIALVIFVSFLFLDRIVILSINYFTDYEVSCGKCKGILSGALEIDAFSATPKKGNIGIFAEKAFFDIRAKESFRKGGLIVDCDLQAAKFIPKDGNKKTVDPEEDVLAMPFSPDHAYDKIALTAFLGRDVIRVTDFKAVSEDILMSGDCTFQADTDNISLDWKISFSPDLSGRIPENIRSATLSHEGEGWYSTVISYKGNLFMLKALYSLTA
jgi:hypothetical protein